MASLSDNLGSIEVALGAALAERRAAFAERMETTIRERIASGEGLGAYSRHPTWYNVVRIPFARSRFERLRAQRSGGRRSRYGHVSMFFEEGYAEYRGVVTGGGTQTTPVNFELTGQLMRNLRGRAAKLAKNRGLRAWLGFRRQQRTYGKLTNREIAEHLNDRYRTRPFWLTGDEADRIFSDIIDESIVASGGE